MGGKLIFILLPHTRIRGLLVDCFLLLVLGIRSREELWEVYHCLVVGGGSGDRIL